MNLEKKVSIVMATYNGSLHLREQLNSIYSQTRIPDEVVVVDDNSTDETLKILEEYNRKYGLLYFENKVNLGVSRNFEKQYVIVVVTILLYVIKMMFGCLKR